MARSEDDVKDVEVRTLRKRSIQSSASLVNTLDFVPIPASLIRVPRL